MLNDLNPIAVIVSMIVSGTFGAFVKDIVTGISKLRGGVSARESKRRIDIVEQRDDAIQQADEARDRAEAEAEKRRRALELAAQYRLQLVKNGIDPGEDQAWSDVQQTVKKERP